MSETPRPCVFFDRDGVVNESPGTGYVERVEDFHLESAFVESLSIVRRKGFEAVLITNQSGVGRGIMSETDLDAVHSIMNALLAERGLAFTGIEFCTDFDNANPRRKPNPGMLLDAAGKYGLDLARSWMVGDSERDITAGRRAGCRTVRVCSDSEETRADFRLNTLEELPAFLDRNL